MQYTERLDTLAFNALRLWVQYVLTNIWIDSQTLSNSFGTHIKFDKLTKKLMDSQKMYSKYVWTQIDSKELILTLRESHELKWVTMDFDNSYMASLWTQERAALGVRTQRVSNLSQNTTLKERDFMHNFGFGISILLESIWLRVSIL